MFNRTELLIVVIIISILVAIAIPNFISMQDRAKDRAQEVQEAKTNRDARTVQLAIEDYAVQNDGMYPKTVKDFQYLLPGGKWLDNAFTDAATEPVDGLASTVGQLGYEPIIQGGVCVGYIITGFDKNAADDSTFLILTSEG